MKRLFTFTAIVLAAFSVIACQDKKPVEPEKPAVVDVTFTTLTNKGVTASDKLNVFSVEATDGNGASLQVEFIGERSFLSAGTYRLRSSVAAGVYRNAYFKSAKVSGAIKEGEFTVATEDSKYTISGVLKLEDDTILKANASGELVYQHEKAAAQHLYTSDISKDENGNNIWTISVYSLEEVLEASFQVMSDSESSPAGSYQITGLEGLAPGKAMTGYDLSIIGLGKGGCYYYENGAILFVAEGYGEIVITEEDEQLNIVASNVTVSDVNGAQKSEQTVSWLYCEEGDITPAGPEYEPLIVAGGSYTETVAAKDNCDEHTIVLKDADGNVTGQVVLRTAKDATSITGEYAFNAEEVAGSLSGGLDLSSLGLGVIGSYYVKDGKTFTLSAGNATVQEGETLSIVLSDVVSTAGDEAGTASPISFLMMTKEASNPDADPTDGVFTYTHTSDAKEGYAEHNFTVLFSNGKTFLNLLVAVADDTSVAGDNIFVPAVYTIVSTEEWTTSPVGKACPGFNFFGMADLGCFYYVNGAINYLTSGVVKLVENADGLVVSIVDAEGNALEGVPTSLAFLSATKATE